MINQDNFLKNRYFKADPGYVGFSQFIRKYKENKDEYFLSGSSIMLDPETVYQRCPFWVTEIPYINFTETGLRFIVPASSTHDRHDTIVVNNLGFFGPNGMVPAQINSRLYYSSVELLLDEQEQICSNPVQVFLNPFLHRLSTLLYQSILKNQCLYKEVIDKYKENYKLDYRFYILGNFYRTYEKVFRFNVNLNNNASKDTVEIGAGASERQFRLDTVRLPGESLINVVKTNSVSFETALRVFNKYFPSGKLSENRIALLDEESFGFCTNAIGMSEEDDSLKISASLGSIYLSGKIPQACANLLWSVKIEKYSELYHWLPGKSQIKTLRELFTLINYNSYSIEVYVELTIQNYDGIPLGSELSEDSINYLGVGTFLKSQEIEQKHLIKLT